MHKIFPFHPDGISTPFVRFNSSKVGNFPTARSVVHALPPERFRINSFSLRAHFWPLNEIYVMRIPDERTTKKGLIAARYMLVKSIFLIPELPITR